MRKITTKSHMHAILGIALGAILMGSNGLILSPWNPAYAVQTYRTFDGNDLVDVPSTPSIQLSQFTAEVNFRVSQLPSERAYLVSKGASNGTGDLDYNYALFVTNLGGLGGGFKASDGTYNYVYTENPVPLSVWNTAKLVYDGAEIKIKVNGTTMASAHTSKNPDTTGVGPVRIGANANTAAGYFIGDIDYVKILDRSTYTKVYFNDFATTDPEPTPEPEPTTDPSGTDCSDIPVKNFRGVVFIDGTLGQTENEAGAMVLNDYVTESMQYLKKNGFNAARVPFYWEAYVANPTTFMAELELVAKTAQENDICVFFDNHHFYTSSYWNLQVEGKSGGRGFPSFVVKNFPAVNNDYIKTAGPFWNAFLSNSITVNGKSVWDVQADFFKTVIAKVDNYDSVAGYEILNEPHLFDKSHYQKLGNYNTYMAKEIREVTDKKIFFDRETTRGFAREPSLEPTIFPKGVSGLVYAPHMYSIPYPGTQAMKQINNFKTWSQNAGTEVLIGEMGAETQKDAEQYLSVLKQYGFGWTAYSWKKAGSAGLGSTLFESDTAPATTALKIMTAAMSAVY